MYSLIQKRKIVAILVIVSFSTLSIISAPVHAKMIDTDEILKQSQHDLSRKSINTFLDRSEVQKYLVAWGVNPEEAKARIDSLTDEEIENISSKMDQLPAGGDAVGVLIGAALFVFIVLLITDILGFTDVFSFVKK
ncbi:MAG TPA: PA2779 family protein [Desulfobacterales bacterium]|nr:PA2779 family protein [Desulfobacterales bacterium]